MKVITNEKLIKRNARIGSTLSLLGLIMLAGGMYISFRDSASTEPQLYNWAFAALIGGFMFSQVGLYFGNRWGRARPVEEILNKALKGIDRNHTLYHYSTPASHVLVGPSGLWVLVTKHQRGKITYEKNRWKQRGGGLLLAYLKLLAQEGIGRPDLEIASETEALKAYLEKKLPPETIPPVQAALVFINPKAELHADEAPIPTVTPKGLKQVIVKESKRRRLSPEAYKAIQKALEEA
ncbi:MAG: NERD domain-containing protein [Anaerolineae bacterium]|nr:MAG: NERD domain-containing protein [Anaerolineae bacterium]